MWRHGVMDLSPHSFFAEMLLQCVTSRGANHEQMPRRPCPRCHYGQNHVGNSVQPLEVTLRECGATRVPFFEFRKFRAKERRLEFTQPRIKSKVFVLITEL